MSEPSISPDKKPRKLSVAHWKSLSKGKKVAVIFLILIILGSLLHSGGSGGSGGSGDQNYGPVNTNSTSWSNGYSDGKFWRKEFPNSPATEFCGADDAKDQTTPGDYLDGCQHGWIDGR